MPTSESPELSVQPYRNASPWESYAWGLGTGAALGSRPSARHPTRSPGPGRRAPLPRPRRGQVWKLFARQGGILSIMTQEPNWSRSPSLPGPPRSPVGPMAVELCAGPGSADVEHLSTLVNSPYKLFGRQGGLLSIATQEPNSSRSPSLLGPSWSLVGPMAVEVCAGPGPADVEH